MVSILAVLNISPSHLPNAKLIHLICVLPDMLSREEGFLVYLLIYLQLHLHEHAYLTAMEGH